MKRRTGKFALAIVVQSLAALLLVASMVPAQTVAVAQVVANNPLKPAGPAQPIPYSHKTHLALNGVQCQTCHTAPGTGELMTFPAASTCMRCHANVAKDKPAIQKLAQLAKGKDPIPWVRVYILRPTHAGEVHEKYEHQSTGVVTWSHKKHLDAGAKCETCHGQVAQMDVMSEVTSAASMGGCTVCHTTRRTVAGALSVPPAQTLCTTCHVWYKNPAVGGMQGKPAAMMLVPHRIHG